MHSTLGPQPQPQIPRGSMRAMILAAGRGERLRPLTDSCPKPLLPIAGTTLIERHLERLKAAGVDDVVINLSWLGGQIRQHLGNGERYGMKIQYSDEGDSALETAGGILRALPLLGEESFWVINGDVLTDFDFQPPNLASGQLARLVCVDNPPHHPDGDFQLNTAQVTYSGIGFFKPEFFSDLADGFQKLGPLLHRALQEKRASLQHHSGLWLDVGSPERLAQAKKILS